MVRPPWEADSLARPAQAPAECLGPVETREPTVAFDCITAGGRPWWLRLAAVLAAILLLSSGIKAFLFQAFVIPSTSMQNTLQLHDRVLVDKFTPWFGGNPQRGDVVVFHDPGGWLAPQSRPANNAVVSGSRSVMEFVGFMPSSGREFLVKRVIAVGGDSVECRAHAPVSVNGTPLDEPYIYPGATPCDDFPIGRVNVPKGHIWVMGDHRNASADSRFEQCKRRDGGFVPLEDVVGRVVAVAWPMNRWTTLETPDSFGNIGSTSY